MTGAEVLGVPLIEWISTYGYAVLVPLFVFEGMLTGFTAGALAGVGWFNPWIVILVYVISKIIADTFVYLIARYFADILRKFEFAQGIIDKMTHADDGGERKWVEFLQKNFFKSIFIAKVAPLPLLDVALLIGAGVIKLSPKKMYPGILLGQPIWSAAIVGVGYFFGDVVKDIAHVFDVTGLIFIMLIIIIGLYYKLSHHYISKHSKLGELIRRK